MLSRSPPMSVRSVSRNRRRATRATQAGARRLGAVWAPAPMEHALLSTPPCRGRGAAETQRRENLAAPLAPADRAHQSGTACAPAVKRRCATSAARFERTAPDAHVLPSAPLARVPLRGATPQCAR